MPFPSRQCLLPLVILALLLNPVFQAANGLGDAAYCGNGGNKSALTLQILRVAPPELVAHLGLAPSDNEHCPLCTIHMPGAVADAFRWQPSASANAFRVLGHTRIAVFEASRPYQSRAPPENRSTRHLTA